MLGAVMLHMAQPSATVDLGQNRPRVRKQFTLHHVDHARGSLVPPHIDHGHIPQDASIRLLPPARRIEICLIKDHAIAAIREQFDLDNLGVEFKFQRVFEIAVLGIHIRLTSPTGTCRKSHLHRARPSSCSRRCSQTSPRGLHGICWAARGH